MELNLDDYITTNQRFSEEPTDRILPRINHMSVTLTRSYLKPTTAPYTQKYMELYVHTYTNICVSHQSPRKSIPSSAKFVSTLDVYIYIG